MRPNLLFIIVGIAVAFGLARGAHGQHLSAGVVTGAGFTEDFQNEFSPGLPSGPGFTNYSTPKRYIAGAMVELGIGSHFSLEVDGLFRPLGYTFAGVEPNGSLNSVSPATVVTWEFPVLAKYRVAFHGVRPFVEAGPSFRTTGNLNSANPSHYGVTAGLGVELPVGGFRITPAVRYTRWAADPEHVVKTVPNQIELVVGFSRASESDWQPFGRHLSLGVTAGTGLTDDFRPTSFTYTNPLNASPITVLGLPGPQSLIAGPTLELSLPAGFVVEADLLHQPLHVTEEAFIGGKKHSSSVSAIHEWDFPVLAKYRFRTHLVKPILELGPSFRLPQGQYGVSHYGVTAGAGVEGHIRLLKIAPSFRYTHWAPNNVLAFSRELPNQVEFLVGFSF